MERIDELRERVEWWRSQKLLAQKALETANRMEQKALDELGQFVEERTDPY